MALKNRVVNMDTKRSSAFAARLSVEQVAEGQDFAPKFGVDGLIACLTTNADTSDALMVGYTNAEALQRTIETGQAHYRSRSRQCLWHKGATSGLNQAVVKLRIDDDQDAVWLRANVAGSGASCHVGHRCCFYRSVPLGDTSGGPYALVYHEDSKTFDPIQVYGDSPNPTQL